MSIIILFIATCVAFTYLGWGVRDILDVKYELPVGSALALGYASSNLLFFICYLIIQDAITATVIVVGLMSILNFCRVLTIKLSSSERIKISIPNTARFWIPFTLFSITVIFSSTSYLQSGLGAYWHTANEDVFDGLNGRNAYLTENLLAAETQLDVGVRLGGELSQSLARDTGIDEKEIDSDVLKRRYIGSTGFLQYSSLAFYSILFFIPMGIDAFMLQALLNLGLFSIGVYSCARSIFEQSARSAFLAAIIATLGQFYFATFLNGHVGSMMYNAIVPFLLYGAIRFEQSSGYTWRTLLLLAILLLFILGAYPFPLPFIATPFLIYLGIKRNKKEVLNIYHLSQRFPILLQVLLGILGLVLLFILAYWIADPIRERALSQFRSWGTILNHVGFLQFWGIWPSQLANTATPLSLLDAQPFVKGVSIVVSLSISAVSCYGCWIFIREKNGFMLSAIPLFILFFFLMRFPVYDSYYVYKYLYINSWVLYVAAVAGFAALFTVSKIWVRYLVVLVFLVWAGSNSVHNVMAFSQISHKDYNEDFGLYSVLLTAPRALLEQSYIAIPVIDKADLVRQILAENQIITEHGKGRAEYFITMKDHQSTLYENYGNLVWESDLFAIVASPIADVPEFASYWGVEGEPENPFVWVSDRRNSRLKLDLHNATGNLRYMFLCGESGPSVSYRGVPITVEDINNTIVGAFVVGAYGCHSLSIDSFQPPFTLFHDEIGEFASFVDRRKLVYRVMAIGFSESLDIAEGIPTSTQTNDIVVPNEEGGVRVNLGGNWYPYEEFEEESFRWVMPDAEIFLEGETSSGQIQFEIELGPSAGVAELQLQLESNEGNLLGRCSISGRGLCSIPIQKNENGIMRFRINSNAAGNIISEDPRILNYRMFWIEWRGGEFEL